MLNYQFKSCISNDREIYAFVEEELNDRLMSTRSAAFPESLLSFLYLDIEWMRPAFQHQVLDLLTQIWITDTSEKTVNEKMTACYLAAEQTEKELFQFRPQRMSYELLYRETFAEILCPDTVYDLVDYHLRECLKREIKKRFAWIRTGRITKDEFYSWSEKARGKKTECEESEITLEEFGQWLKES